MLPAEPQNAGMHKHKAVWFVWLASAAGLAQEPTGTISGLVSDPSGAAIHNARVTVANLSTGLDRKLETSAEGRYAAPALPAGSYQVKVEAEGFRSLIRPVTVEAGATTTADLTLQVGDASQTVTVGATAPQIRFDHHQVSGLVSRAQIENLPLNGRNFLDLAKLEPGITNASRGANNRIYVRMLGTGGDTAPRVGYTRVTVDGGSILGPGLIGAALKVSQEAVQEFQISTINFDPATSVTANGAINIVTRSGGNDFHGAGFYFFRDHNMAAYPGLTRDPANPSPFFQRREFGYQLGGPIQKDRAFFFTNLERNEQRGVFSLQPRTPEFARAGGIFSSPTFGTLFSARWDARLHPNHNAFVRYTHDGNRFFGPVNVAGGTVALPSSWSRANNWVDQSLAALTSVVGTTVVNELRFSYFFFSSPEAPPGPADCPNCLGLGAARIVIADAGVRIGNPRTLSLVSRRYQLTEGLTWQKSAHRLRFGFDWEHWGVSGSNLDSEPAQLNLYAPREARLSNIPLPRSFSTIDDILRLPLRSFLTGIGPPRTSQPAFRKARISNLYRLYAADAWRLHPRLTLNWGLAWSYEHPNLNYDLTKPLLLLPLVGAGGLNPPAAPRGNFSPTLGFAWAATRDGKTVVRGGAGRFFDSIIVSSQNVGPGRAPLLPFGAGRSFISGSSIFRDGRALDFTIQPTSYTGADLLAILPAIRANLERGRDPNSRDFSVRNIDVSKSTSNPSNLSDPFNRPSYALHFNLGMQRELARELVVSADFVWRHFVRTPINNIDYNRFRSAQGPIIPRCTAAQRNDPRAACSNGSIEFDNTTGLTRYKGLLVRIEKRFSGRVQFLGSYALASNVGSNAIRASPAFSTGFNNDNWFENYGPLDTDQRHVLNVSGIIELPRRFRLSSSISYYSRSPFSVFVSNQDFNGDGTFNDLLPGTKVNQFNRGLGKDDLARLVEGYNRDLADKVTPVGQIAPRLTVPANYSFDDNFFTQDLRLSRTFHLKTERLRLVLFGEVFNLFNAANLVGHSGNIANPAIFGQPTSRVGQVFGSGGPRAFQLGARVSF